MNLRLRAMWERDPRCFWCGRETQLHHTGRDNSATRDHIYPRNHPKRQSEARHLPPNVLACRRCNHDRGAPAPTTSQACPLLEAA